MFSGTDGYFETAIEFKMSEVLIENIIAYIFVFGLVALITYFYLKKIKKRSEATDAKIIRAKEFGLHEPLSLHPVIDTNSCIGSGACIEACPEKDIIGWKDGKSATINTSRCVGHGACFHACPVGAISLFIGTEKRGVDLPHVSKEFETNMPMIFIAGELGGMGLIKNAVEQGKQSMTNIARRIPKGHANDFDAIIVGSGPAGIAASLTAKKESLKFLTLEQDSLGGTVYSFPRSKIVMTSPMDLPLHGRVNFKETSKTELLNLWNEALSKNQISINENEKVDSIEKNDNGYVVRTAKNSYSAASVLLAIGRRGSPRKLNVKGENKPKVFYRLLEPELINEKNILVVGGGDSAVESAMLLADSNNKVALSYRAEAFSRLKPMNASRIQDYAAKKSVELIFNSNVEEIRDDEVLISASEKKIKLPNDLVYIFAGGELPTKFLEKIGIRITTKFGEALLKH